MHMIEAGFPMLEPKDAELFDAAGRASICGETRDRRVRDDPAQRRDGGRRPGADRVLAESFAPVVTLVGKTWDLHVEKVDQGRPRGEPAR